eukprot:Tbor_TRINITY_DN5210_c0_g1::TRINITY_DN5210_c0_g1_i1::g.16208::m.16208
MMRATLEIYFISVLCILSTGGLASDVLSSLSNKQATTVQSLNSANLERTTQITTGSTTGNWFIMFYTNGDNSRQPKANLVELAALFQEHRTSIAQVDCDDVKNKKEVCEWLGVKNPPEYILFRSGKMLRYTGDLQTVASWLAFLQALPPQSNFEHIPPVETIWPSPFLVMAGIIVVMAAIAMASSMCPLNTAPKKKKGI